MASRKQSSASSAVRPHDDELKSHMDWYYGFTAAHAYRRLADHHYMLPSEVEWAVVVAKEDQLRQSADQGAKQSTIGMPASRCCGSIHELRLNEAISHTDGGGHQLVGRIVGATAAMTTRFRLSATLLLFWSEWAAAAVFVSFRLDHSNLVGRRANKRADSSV